MTPTQAEALRALLRDQRVASLATLHDGAASVTMVPFALLPGGVFAIHVSHLSSHTQDLLREPAVSLLVHAADDGERPAQALARVTVQGTAAAEPAAREAYLARFPEAAEIAEIPGFTFFAIRPTSVRFIAGFAQAISLTPEAFAAALEALG